jgi:NAD-dependent deacetylase
LPVIPPHDSQGRLLRPHVVWFGEMLDQVLLDSALDVAQASELFISCGTSSVVYPAAALPYAAQRRGAVLVEINPDSTGLSRAADYVLRGRAGEILPTLWAAVAEILASAAAG